ncbi:unnamed protein product [Ceutorhynchus assimilis]|uniref:17S U2 SnRNP complex component HTATSF1 n=1 Tax=Ceutorhynchus assimilis TaxID=467358 RepID=A0A9N9QL10_9CUCU|nr:unnamed protein product [Ceutorhynchus assimilis]
MEEGTSLVPKVIETDPIHEIIKPQEDSTISKSDPQNIHYEGENTPKANETDLINEVIEPQQEDSTSKLDPQNIHYKGEANETDLNKKVIEPQQEDATSNFDPQNIHYEGEIAIYTDKTTNFQYQWDKDKSEWVPTPKKTSYSFEDDTHVYTDSDGTKLFWDKEKHAWFPKLDEDFMVAYQMNYGFTKPEDPKPEIDPTLTKPIVAAEKRKASEPTWFEVDQNQNTNVYVANLPLDIEEQEFVDLMQKCGLVMRDVQTGKFKVKLYRDQGTGDLKGDALCTYIKIESVDLALSLLDGYEYKNKKIKVERAQFQLKGAYDPKLKPKMKKRKDKLKLKKQQEKLFDWRPEKKLDERAKHERIVIIRNLFDPKLFDKDVSLILEFQQDLREEAGKIGEVRKVTIYDRHPEGVAQISMAQPEEADQVVKMLNGRWFMKRQLTAEIWDGKTKFKIAETDSEINQRLEGWDKFLEEEEEEENDKN